MARLENSAFHLPGASDPAISDEVAVSVSGTIETDTRAAYCVEKL